MASTLSDYAKAIVAVYAAHRTSILSPLPLDSQGVVIPVGDNCSHAVAVFYNPRYTVFIGNEPFAVTSTGDNWTVTYPKNRGSMTLDLATWLTAFRVHQSTLCSQLPASTYQKPEVTAGGSTDLVCGLCGRRRRFR